MSRLSALLRSVEGGGLLFWCPGCDSAHLVYVENAAPPRSLHHGARWGYNGDPDRPTFTPSVLVTYNGADAGIAGAPPAVCHSFVTDGQIRFLADCTHVLAGRTMPLPPFDEDQP